jgi:SpoVK/Ycf46/Vps4 family AAA+-type ATPase
VLARRSGGERRYLLVGGGLLAAYVVAAVVLATTRDFDDRGPLSLNNRPVENLPIVRKCFADARPDDVKVVGGTPIDGVVYFACYKLYDDGTVEEARVVDERGFRVTDPSVIKKGGAWRWVGTVTRTSDLVFAAFPLAALVGLGWLYHRRRRPPPATEWWEQGWVAFVLACSPVLGWIALAALRVPRSRKARAALQAVFALAGLLVFSFLVVAATTGDTWGVVAVGMIGVALAWALLGGRLLLPGPATPAGQAPEPPPPPPPLREAESVTVSGPPPQRARVKAKGDQADPFSLSAPGDLPSFADVGGMDLLKRELKDSFGLMLAFAGEARAYRLRWNGLLLHGPPGVGKTFIARSTAGEFGLSFVHVSTADIVSSYAGEAARNVRRAFSFAASHVPCILFFDEFDSIAQRRDDWPNQEARRTVNELLRAVEEWRKVPELIVMAATNDLESLDPAVIRPGRFDRHIRVDLPDAEARAAIFTAQLSGRPVEPDLDVDELAQLAEGLTPAAIGRAVESASLRAFREATTSGGVVRLSRAHLRAALTDLGGTDRPTVERWSWDQLVLPPGVEEELKQVVALLRNPDLARSLGIDPPTGVLLSGPPGTGKTTIAKVLAAEAGCSFYPVTGADVTSMWLGESERSIARLFDRARENRPSIIFFDEIDAIAGTRGEWGGYDRQINQLLAEIDGISGQKGVLVVGATNRPDQLDPALLRGGRLSRRIEIPLPDRDARLTLLRLFTAPMPLEGVDLEALARQTDGLSGADLKALCQQAAVEALTRVTAAVGGPAGDQPAVTPADMAKALATRLPESARPRDDRRTGPYI